MIKNMVKSSKITMFHGENHHFSCWNRPSLDSTTALSCPPVSPPVPWPSAAAQPPATVPGLGAWAAPPAPGTKEEWISLEASGGEVFWSEFSDGFSKWIFNFFDVCMSNGLVNVISSGFKLVLSRSSMGNLYVWTGELNAARSGFQTATVEVESINLWIWSAMGMWGWRWGWKTRWMVSPLRGLKSGSTMVFYHMFNCHSRIRLIGGTYHI